MNRLQITIIIILLLLKFELQQFWYRDPDYFHAIGNDKRNARILRYL